MAYVLKGANLAWGSEIINDIKRTRTSRPNFDKMVIKNIRVFKLRLDLLVLSRPWLSTTISAAILSAVWLTAWMIVLIISSLATTDGRGEITAIGFLSGLILSTVAESLIRRGEQSNLSKRYNHGRIDQLQPDQSFSKAALIFVAGAILVISIEAFGELPKTFSLVIPENKQPKNWIPMVCQWRDEISGNPVIQRWLYIAFFIRIYIYKQRHDTKNWQRTKEHILKKKKRFRVAHNIKDRQISAMIFGTMLVIFLVIRFGYVSGNVNGSLDSVDVSTQMESR